MSGRVEDEPVGALRGPAQLRGREADGLDEAGCIRTQQREPVRQPFGERVGDHDDVDVAPDVEVRRGRGSRPAGLRRRGGGRSARRRTPWRSSSGGRARHVARRARRSPSDRPPSCVDVAEHGFGVGDRLSRVGAAVGLQARAAQAGVSFRAPARELARVHEPVVHATNRSDAPSPPRAARRPRRPPLRAARRPRAPPALACRPATSPADLPARRAPGAQRISKPSSPSTATSSTST